LSIGDIFNAYEHFCVAGLWNTAHDLAVLELAPDAIMRNDLMLVESLVIKFQGKSVDGWHVRGKVGPFSVSYDERRINMTRSGVPRFRQRRHATSGAAC
jgi:hypothetical protein